MRRRISCLTNAHLEGVNGLCQVAQSRARGYSNEAKFIAMIYPHRHSRGAPAQSGQIHLI
ncbi:transposase [Halomonas sp. 1390]|uniref:transposase n=1 Tax=Halomonas sp. B23F22_3 TaxID=3459516 RepID=UPI00373EDE9F